MSLDLAQGLTEAKALFRSQWSDLLKQSSYTGPLTPEGRRRHLQLWDQLTAGLASGYYQPYLQIIEQEGRCQAQAGTDLPTLLGQLNEFMNLVWQVLTSTSRFEETPQLLINVTRQLNTLRYQAQTALLKGYNDELRRLDIEKLNHTKQLQRNQLVAKTELVELLKSVPGYKCRRYRSSQYVFEPGYDRSLMYFIVEGKVRIHELLRDGRAISLSILGQYDVFAQSPSRNSYFHDVYAEAMCETTVIQFQQQGLVELMEVSPVVTAQIIESFSQQLFQTQRLIEGLLCGSVVGRLARLLLDLAGEFGETTTINSNNSEQAPLKVFVPAATPKEEKRWPNDSRVQIKLNLTHQQLADMIGSNRVTVTRSLEELVNRKLIEMGRQTIVLLDPKTMEELAA